MATKPIRGMGSFFKTCSCKRQGGCAHPYAIRFRDGAGRQCPESSYPTQDDALDRLTQIYRDKRSNFCAAGRDEAHAGQPALRGVRRHWLPRQRHFAPGTIRTVKQLLDRQILPALESRRINSFSPAVVDDFIMSMEERKVGLPTQQNTFDTLKKILWDAHRRGGISDDPFQGVVPPEYIPNRVTIPTLEEIHALKEVGSKALVVIIDLMSGGGHRNGEAFAANLEGMVADDVYRITEQIEGKTRQRAPLKHRKPGEFREVPMPATVRESLLRYAHEAGADENGFLLRTQRSPYWSHKTLEYQWSAARKRAGITRKLNPYTLRHFFASNCLSKGIPITDVAEWMGHSNINLTYRIYRHLMPASIGRAAKTLEAGL